MCSGTMRIGSVRAGMTVWGVSCRRAIRGGPPPWAYGRCPRRERPGRTAPDAEAPKSPELDLVALGERLRDPVEDGVDDGLGFLLGEARQPRQRLDQAGFRHGRALEATVSVGTGQTRAHERPAKLVQ